MDGIVPHKHIDVAGVVIAQDQAGRFCLNDLHKASGGEDRHRPSRFLENQQAKALATEIDSDAGIPASVSTVRGGPKQGTFACKEIVYAYAMWISAKFHLRVIRTFDAAQASQIFSMPTTLAGALRLAADLEDQRDQLAEKSAQLETKISTDAPKVAFAETIRAIDGVCHIEKIAKTLGIGRNKFFKRLRDDSILMTNNLPYQKYIDREYFTVIEGSPYVDSKKVSHPTFTAMVTGAGQVFLANRYGAAAVAALAMQAAANTAAKEAA